VATAAVMALAVSSAEAAAFALGEKEIGQAIAVGQRSATSDAAFDAEWRLTNAAGEVAMVVTPFHRIALAARHAAFKSEPLKPAEQERILRELKDRLSMWVVLKGSREDFARHYAPRVIVVGGDGKEQEIVPTFVQNERTALKQGGGGFVARCFYEFPTKQIAGTSRGTLVVRDVEGREVSRFSFDLSRMR
jgi:hypothetical protein